LALIKAYHVDENMHKIVVAVMYCRSEVRVQKTLSGSRSFNLLKTFTLLIPG
jgi:hypothetical protein